MKRSGILIGVSMFLVMHAADSAPNMRSWASPQDDSEIFMGGINVKSAHTLMMFDTSSASNASLAIDRLRYDPSYAYSGPFDAGRLYFIPSYETFPQNAGDAYDRYKNSWVVPTANQCAVSLNALASVGFYDMADAIMSYRYQEGNSAERFWLPMDSSAYTHESRYIDCMRDSILINPGNPSAPLGFPSMQGAATSNDGYVAKIEESNRLYSTSTALYTGNFINWYYDDTAAVNSMQTPLDYTKWVASMIVDSHVDNATIFSIMRPIRYDSVTKAVCGTSEPRSSCISGGQVVSDGAPMSTASINALTPQTYTPVEGMFYEAHKYLDEEMPAFGGALPGTDASAIDGAGKYSVNNSTNQCGIKSVHIVYITNSYPAEDKVGRDAWGALISPESEAYTNKQEPSAWTGKTYSDNYTQLKDIASFMVNEHGAQIDIVGLPFVSAASAPFEPTLYQQNTKNDQQLWNYTQTYDARSLLFTLKRGIKLQFNGGTSTAVSPVAATSRFSKTRSEDNLYVGAFEPSSSPAWNGNVFEVPVSNWGPNALPADITKGGFASGISVANRRIYTNTGVNNSLEPFDESNIQGYLKQRLLESGIYEAELDDTVAWVHGYKNINTTPRQERNHLMGDVYHFSPIIANYGDTSNNNKDKRLLIVGTNQGMLHAFDPDTKKEVWSFIPHELYALLPRLRGNQPGEIHPYGIDGKATVYRVDKNGNGKIEPSDGDKMYLYVSLRRGGQDISSTGSGASPEYARKMVFFALDISNPNTPKWLFSKSGLGWWGYFGSSTDPLNAQGQIWSEIQVTGLPSYYDEINGVREYKPLLIFTSGYDPVPFDIRGTVQSSYAKASSSIIMMDAQTGEIIRTIGWSGGDKVVVTNSLFSRIASAPTLWDADADGLTDRIYFADLSGAIYRIDVSGDTLPNGQTRGTFTEDPESNWSIRQIARLDYAEYLSDPDWNTKHTRRFFVKIDVVRSRYRSSSGARIPFDALLIGTGHANNPNETTIENRFYMVRDPYIWPTKFVAKDPQSGQMLLPPVIQHQDLYDATDNLIQDASSESARSAEADILSSKMGWYIRLTAPGEKVLARAVTMNHVTYFATFIPAVNIDAGCSVSDSYATRLYAVKLQDGSAVYPEFAGNLMSLNKLDRYKTMGAIVTLDTLGVHFNDDGEATLLLPGETKFNTNRRLTTRNVGVYRDEKQ